MNMSRSWPLQLLVPSPSMVLTFKLVYILCIGSAVMFNPPMVLENSVVVAIMRMFGLKPLERGHEKMVAFIGLVTITFGGSQLASAAIRPNPKTDYFHVYSSLYFFVVSLALFLSGRVHDVALGIGIVELCFALVLMTSFAVHPDDPLPEIPDPVPAPIEKIEKSMKMSRSLSAINEIRHMDLSASKDKL